MEIGEKYNKLECIKFVDSDKRGKKFLFKCDCGNEVVYTGTYGRRIIDINHVVCMKYNKNKDEDILNNIYCRLKPMKRVENIQRGRSILCDCDCGKSK